MRCLLRRFFFFHEEMFFCKFEMNDLDFFQIFSIRPAFLCFGDICIGNARNQFDE